MQWSAQFGKIRTDRFFVRAARLAMTSLSLPLLTALSFLTGCMGDLGALGSNEGGPGGRSPGGPNSPGGDGDGDGDVVPLKGPSAGLRKLSANEYRFTVRDLIGVDLVAADALPADTPVSGFTSIGTARVAFSAQHIESFEQLAYQAAQQIFEDEQGREEFVGCAPTSSEDPCVREFLTTFARRAFRRPATSTEVDVYATLVTEVAETSDVWSGLAYAVAAYLQSPDLLYRVELGNPDDSTEAGNKLNAFEIATRLSYLVTGSTPDDQLLDAAEAGLLDDEPGFEGELERLLALPEAEEALLQFLGEQLELGHVDQIVKVPSVFPAFNPALASAMKREMYEVVREVSWRNPDDLLTLLSSRNTFVNSTLAEFYGVPGPASADEWVPATWPEESHRTGFLGLLGFLASHAGPAETSVTKRGFFVVSKLMCMTIPSPPDGVDTLLPAPPAGGHATMRERVEQHMEDPSCNNCHSKMDPPGLALEHFDAMGVYREMDGGLPIDATGEIAGVPFDGARELGLLLSEHPEVAACMARRFYEFALGTQAHSGAPIAELLAAFEQSGRRFPELVRALVKHEVFRIVSEPR